MLTTIYPGWQFETEVGYGGISYDTELKEQNRQFFQVLRISTREYTNPKILVQKVLL